MKDYALLQPFSKYNLELKNRVVMTAMTRNFSDDAHYPTDLIRAYYERRAANDIGLILTEGVIIHPKADGYPNVPYIHTDEHAEKWKPIVEAVHKHGAKFFMQLWHCGRISHPFYLNGELPVAPSAVPPEGALHPRLKQPFVTPRALETREIPGIVEMFAHAARNALHAGFDGVEIHGGHGYLIDTFFNAHANKRTDKYGGSVENRCRFGLEVTKAVLDIAGPERTFLRISPSRELDGVLFEWPDLEEMLNYLIPELNKLGLTFLDISSARSDYYKTSGKIVREVRPLWPHVIIAGASLPPEKADEEIKSGLIDLVTYGRFILANPDFVKKIRNGEELIPFNPEMLKTLY